MEMCICVAYHPSWLILVLSCFSIGLNFSEAKKEGNICRNSVSYCHLFEWLRLTNILPSSPVCAFQTNS